MKCRFTPLLTKDRVAVITGAASGIGLAAAIKLASLGMKLCLADIDAAALDAPPPKSPARRASGDVRAMADRRRAAAKTCSGSRTPPMRASARSRS